MLVLSRKLNESIMIGDEIELVVLDIHDSYVKLGIKAPRAVSIHRKEVFEEITAENKRALQKPASKQVNDAARLLNQRQQDTK